ncbi:hypothetical protein ACFQ7J_10290 [Streptomyces sp. NPDC056501]|uniref:hypothetical protein n=1 Tax=Streptomyces sp. NPDC056501 TaxID=3345841 RepID=UPI0036845973
MPRRPAAEPVSAVAFATFVDSAGVQARKTEEKVVVERDVVRIADALGWGDDVRQAVATSAPVAARATVLTHNASADSRPDSRSAATFTPSAATET